MYLTWQSHHQMPAKKKKNYDERDQRHWTPNRMLGFNLGKGHKAAFNNHFVSTVSASLTLEFGYIMQGRYD